MHITIELNFFTVLKILSTSTSFMLGLLFLTSKSKNNKANVFLGLFLWSLAVEVFGSFMEISYIKKISYINLDLLTIFFLFLYVIKTFHYTLKPIYILLIIPFLLVFFNVIPSFIHYVFNMLLLICIIKLIRGHQQKLRIYYSNIENRTLTWVKTIVYILLFFHFFWIFGEIIDEEHNFLVSFFPQILDILTLIMIYWIGYNGFLQPEIFNTVIKAEERKKKKEYLDNQNAIWEKNQKASTIQQFNQICEIISHEKIFLDADIDLYKLSKHLDIKDKELSKLIKTHTKRNFYCFINKFRIEEFKQLLFSQKSNQFSILGLAQEAGFKSKSTFYTAFKNLEGKTPKKYQKEVMANVTKAKHSEF